MLTTPGYITLKWQLTQVWHRLQRADDVRAMLKILQKEPDLIDELRHLSALSKATAAIRGSTRPRDLASLIQRLLKMASI